jgi:hypothetical protein
LLVARSSKPAAEKEKASAQAEAFHFPKLPTSPSRK